MLDASLGRLLIGGLGWPHDEFAAAALTAMGLDCETLGAFDAEALEGGRRALPRGQCAPALYTTGALLRAVSRGPRDPRSSYLSLGSCGPCRFALFPRAWRNALDDAGFGNVDLLELGQTADEVMSLFAPPDLTRLLDCLIAADLLVESLNRLRPHVADPDGLDRCAERASISFARRVAEGATPQAELERMREWHRHIPRRRARPLGRALIIGDPWSIHVHGDGQLNLPRVLARIGVECELPPLATWLFYLLWEVRQGSWRTGEVNAREVERAVGIEWQIRRAIRVNAAALGLGPLDVPSIEVLAEFARPYISPSIRGGYGHVEVGLAVRAAQQRRAHVVFSVKSFGCIPSAGISDAIVPSAIGSQIPFLSLEVSGDGAAARESRVLLQAAAALERAKAEFDQACHEHAVDPEDARRTLGEDPLHPVSTSGVRASACTLACAVAAWAN